MNREPVQIHKRRSFTAKDRARIFAAHKGICGLSGLKIGVNDPWEIEHRVALALGGTNDDENLYPALVDPHKAKTKQDVKAIAKAKRLAGETGQNRIRKPIPSRGFQKPKEKKPWPKRSFPKRGRDEK